jgi:hypothetical protein
MIQRWVPLTVKANHVTRGTSAVRGDIIEGRWRYTRNEGRRPSWTPWRKN